MIPVDAVCPRCGAAKELPLGRCAACGDLPAGDGAELAVLCSTRVLDAEQLAEVAARIRRGEPVQPSAALRARAREALRAGRPQVEARLDTRQQVALFLANLLLTPLLGYAAWFALRTRPGPAARQALWVTIPASLLLALALGLGLWLRAT